MTTCAEALSVLSTTRLDEIPQNSAVAHHIETCPNCSRLVTDMKYADERLALSLDSSVPPMPPTLVSANAISHAERDRREFVATWIRRSLAFAAGITVVAFLRSDTGKYLTGADDFQRQSIQINCIPASTALDAAATVLRSTRSNAYASPDRRLITVQGPFAEVRQALTKIEMLDRSAPSCTLPPATTQPAPVPTPGAGKSGKD